MREASNSTVSSSVTAQKCDWQPAALDCEAMGQGPEMSRVDETEADLVLWEKGPEKLQQSQ